MGKIQDKELERVKELYYGRKFSVREVAAELHVSIYAVTCFMRRHKLPRRGFAEINKDRFAKKPLSFAIPNYLTPELEALQLAGVMLYWGEGHQAQRASGIDFSNSKPDMVLVFARFLRNICHVDESRLRGYLYCYADQNVEEILGFWSQLTSIPREQIGKPYIRKDVKEQQKGKMPYGLFHIRYADKKLLWLVKDWINEYAGILGGIS